MPRVPVGLVGPTSRGRSVAQQSARSVNLIPEVNDADSKAVVALHSAPGYFRWADISALIDGEPAIRGFHNMGGRFFAVVAEKIVEILYDATLTHFNLIDSFASLSTFSGRVGMSDNGGKLIVGDGTGFYVLNLVTRALATVINDPGDGQKILGTFSRWIDGYTLYFERDSSRYFYSELNDPATVKGLNFMSAEGDPDNTVAAIVNNREVAIIGSNSVEYHYDSGNADNAFQRIDGGTSPNGCVARWSACLFDNTVTMVGRNSAGQGAVWRLGRASTDPVRVSTPAVETAISKALFSTLDRTDRTEQITAYVYQDTEEFYVLNLPATDATVNSPAQPSQTWAYGATTNLWHERAYLNPQTGLFERALAEHHVTWKNRHYFGAYDHAHIYEMSNDYYRENTLALVKMRETSHLTAQGLAFTVDRLLVEMQVGDGRDGGVQGSDPQLMLQVSRDGGRTYGNEIWRSFGKRGEYLTIVGFGPLGYGRDFVFRFTVADPVPVTFLRAFADISLAA